MAFAPVGRFFGGRRGAERELLVVYTEMDGGFNNGGDSRRISWSSRGNGGRERGGGLNKLMRNLLGCFRGGIQRSTSTKESRSLRASSLSRSSLDPPP